jgi:hypothetical protein
MSGYSPFSLMKNIVKLFYETSVEQGVSIAEPAFRGLVLFIFEKMSFMPEQMI